MITVTLTTEEAKAAIALCDIACKTAGLQVAEAALVIARKIEAAAKAADEE